MTSLSDIRYRLRTLDPIVRDTAVALSVLDNNTAKSLTFLQNQFDELDGGPTGPTGATGIAGSNTIIANINFANNAILYEGETQPYTFKEGPIIGSITSIFPNIIINTSTEFYPYTYYYQQIGNTVNFYFPSFLTEDELSTASEILIPFTQNLYNETIGIYVIDAGFMVPGCATITNGEGFGQKRIVITLKNNNLFELSPVGFTGFSMSATINIE